MGTRFGFHERIIDRMRDGIANEDNLLENIEEIASFYRHNYIS